MTTAERIEARERPITSGDAFKRLVEVLALLEAIEQRAADYARAGHGADWGCRFCARDCYGEFAGVDMAGLLWVAQSVSTSIESAIAHHTVVSKEVDVRVRYRPSRPRRRASVVRR